MTVAGSSFLDAVTGLTSGIGSQGGGGINWGSTGAVPAPQSNGAPFPNEQAVPGGGWADSVPANIQAQYNAPATPAVVAPAATPQMSLADLLTALLGAAPSAPTAAQFGPTPTLDQFFSSAPYSQAQSQLQAGSKAAGTSIGGAYTAAQAALAGIAKNAQAATAASQGQANADALASTNQANGYIGAATAAAGPGGGVAGRLAGLQAALAGQNGASKTLDAQLAGIQNNNMAQQAGNLTSAQQNAMNLLASQTAGEGNKISLSEAADQANGQHMLDAALASQGAAESKANSDYQTQLGQYTTNRNNLLQNAFKASGSSSDTADQTATQWLEQGQSGNSGAQNQFNAYTTAMTSVSPTTGKPPTTAAEALQNVSALQQAKGQVLTPAQWNAVAQNVQQAFAKGTSATTVSPDAIRSYLQSMLGASS